ncbi:MAG: glycoside hydrolase family 3 N-terminal domain-containing protein [Flavobacteriales bacterium]
MATLTLREQIAQLLMPPIYAHATRERWDEMERWVETHQLGGVIAMQGAPTPYTERLNRLQDRAQIPLLVSTDAEWGLGMRIDSTRSWPRALTFGAAGDTALTRAFGREVGRSLQAMGMHVNFAPVVDVNSNPANPVIGSRSFGSSTELAGVLGSAYAKGLQDVGVLATAKHFPGHGDTDADSHYALPIIRHGRSRLDSIELVPFRTLIEEGAGAMMAAHLYIPSLDSTPNQPSTLSRSIVHGILRDELGFEGLVFTDAMTMKGFTSFTQTSTPHTDALLAGNDVLLFPGEPAATLDEIEGQVRSGRLDSLLIADKCRRLLAAKSWTQAAQSPEGHWDSNAAETLHRQVISKALTTVKNDEPGLPFRAHVRRVEQVFVGFDPGEVETSSRRIQSILGSNAEVNGAALTKEAFESAGMSQLDEALSSEPDWVVLHIGGTSHRAAKGHGVTDAAIDKIAKYAAQAHKRNVPLALVIYGSPYLLNRLSAAVALSDAVIIAYQDDSRTVEAVANALTGTGPAGGHLPVATDHFPLGHGMPWMGRMRLGFSAIPISTTAAIDSIVLDAIDKGAMPGCRVVVAHQGCIVHDGIYGTLDGKQPVQASTLYDLASITKIAASTLSLMRLEEEGKIALNTSLDTYLPELQGTDMGSRQLRDVLSHRAGLQSWIPFYLEALEDSTAFSPVPTEVHQERISDACYMRPAWRDSIWDRIVASEVDAVGTHRYSDLGYYAIQRIIEGITGKGLAPYTSEQFYAPAHWNSLVFNPGKKGTASVAPTEVDTLFRRCIVQGDVHDPGAAMLGGVCGHAGLFGNAYDLTRLMYMLRMGGTYGGVDFFQPETIQAWTQRVDPDPDHRKACGFDRPANEPDAGPTCDEASESSFGHSGFTGTLAWADPDHDLVYVFLSNRTYPSAQNRKLIDWDVRTKVQHQVYKAYGIPSRFNSEME